MDIEELQQGIPTKGVQFLKDLYKLSTEELFTGLAESEYKKEYIKTVCKYRWDFFIIFFFQEYLQEDFSPMHKMLFEQEHYNYKNQLFGITDFKNRATYKDVLAAPRGHAKSTFETLFKPLWCCLQTPPLEQYILILSNTHAQAKDRLRDIKKELEQNQWINYIYGDQEGDVWSDKKLTTRYGVRIQIASAESSIRGAREGWSRPSLIILDDAEDEKNITTEVQRKHMKEWFEKDVMKLGGKYTNFSFVGTILHHESLLKKTIENPMWNSQIFRSLIAEPINKQLWEQWKSIFMDAGNKERKKSADQFYIENKKEMLEGSQLLWGEHESLKDLQEMRLSEGEYSFQTEKQNNPIDPESQIFDVYHDWSFVKLISVGAFQFLQDTETQSMINLSDCRLTAWLDPTTGTTAGDPDYAAIAVIAQYEKFQFWVDAWMKKCSTYEQIEQIFILGEKWNEMGYPITTFGIEANNFQRLFLQDVQRRRAERKNEGQFYEVYPQGKHQQANKQNRILALQPKFKNGWIKPLESIKKECIIQFESFQIGRFKVHDDMPDAVEGASQLSQKNFFL